MRYNCLLWRASVGALLAGVVVFSSRACAATIDFEDVSLPSSDFYNGSDGAGGFTSRGQLFPNYYSTSVYNGITYAYWDNWACSRTTDITTGDFSNQFSAIAGGGANGSAQYAVGFPSFSTNLSTIALANPGTVQGAFFTNTTYAYLSMLNGYNGAKKFGGDTGADPDWFKLAITGKDSSGATHGPIYFYLADFSDPNPQNHYILNQWTWTDLSSLGNDVQTLQFKLTSTDNGDFGMNTPGYFAIDDLIVSSVPEPSAFVLLAIAALGLLIWSKI